MAGVEAASLSPVPVPKQWNVGQVANLPKHGRLAICPTLAPADLSERAVVARQVLFPLPSATASRPSRPAVANSRGGFGHGGDVAGGGRSKPLAVVGQNDREVVDVYRAVAGELALGPRRAGLAVVGQHDRQVVDVHLAVVVRVAGHHGGQEKGVGWSARRRGP